MSHRRSVWPSRSPPHRWLPELSCGTASCPRSVHAYQPSMATFHLTLSKDLFTSQRQVGNIFQVIAFRRKEVRPLVVDETLMSVPRKSSRYRRIGQGNCRRDSFLSDPPSPPRSEADRPQDLSDGLSTIYTASIPLNDITHRGKTDVKVVIPSAFLRMKPGSKKRAVMEYEVRERQSRPRSGGRNSATARKQAATAHSPLRRPLSSPLTRERGRGR